MAARLLAVADATAEGSRLDAVVDAARAAAVQMWEAARAAGCERDVPGPAVLDVGARICAHAQAADDGLRGLGVDLAALADEVRWLRMRIALLRRHNLMVGTFAVELLDGEPGGKVGAAGDALASMELLCRALTEGAQELSAAHGRVRAATREIPGTVQEAVRLGDRILRLARRWRAEVVAYGVADAAAPQLTALDEHTAEGFDELRRFHAVAARCRLLDARSTRLGCGRRSGRWPRRSRRTVPRSRRDPGGRGVTLLGERWARRVHAGVAVLAWVGLALVVLLSATGSYADGGAIPKPGHVYGINPSGGAGALSRVADTLS